MGKWGREGQVWWGSHYDLSLTQPHLLSGGILPEEEAFESNVSRLQFEEPL